MDKKTTAKATAPKVKASTKKTTATKKRATTAKKTTTPKKTGRPKAEINKRQFEQMCEWQCTRSEIASHFDVDECTITRWCKATYGMDFASVCKIKAENGKSKLRHIQFRMAESGSERMAIWLGKQWLGQTDKQDIAIAEIDDGNRNEIEAFLNDPGTNSDPQ